MLFQFVLGVLQCPCFGRRPVIKQVNQLLQDEPLQSLRLLAQSFSKRGLSKVGSGLDWVSKPLREALVEPGFLPRLVAGVILPGQFPVVFPFLLWEETSLVPNAPHCSFFP